MRRPCTIRTPRRPSAFYKPPAPFRATKPASRGTCRATAVKPIQAASLLRPCEHSEQFGGQGALPLVRAMRPVAEWRSFLFNKQGEHTKPASREACCRAAVKPRPSSMSPYAPARLWRAVRKGAQPPWMSTRPTGAERGQGVLPLVMRRRTWAVMSSRGVPPEARMALRMSASAMRWG